MEVIINQVRMLSVKKMKVMKEFCQTNGLFKKYSRFICRTRSDDNDEKAETEAEEEDD